MFFLLTTDSGRKWGMAVGQFLTIVGAAFQAGSQNRGQYMGSRAILGTGIAFVTCAGPALLSELAMPSIRGTLVSFFNPFWYLGSIIVAWTCFGTSHMDATNSWNWRIPSLLQAAIPCIVLPTIYWLPESPRWLASVGRGEEAKNIIAKYHGNGNMDDPLVTAQMAEIEHAMEVAREGVTWRALLTRKTNHHRLFIVITMTLMTLWCGQNIITFYFSSILTSVGVTDTTQQTGINGGLNIVNFISSLAGAAIVDRIGRRKLWMTSYAGMILIFVPFIALSAVYSQKKRQDEGYGVIVCLFLFDIMYNVACNPLLYSYATEIMPFYMRSKGLAVKNFVGQIALIINMWVNPIALAAIEYHYYIFFLGLNCVWLYLIWCFFPETSGYSLEELSIIFEDGNHAVEILNAVEVDRDAKDVSEYAVKPKADVE
ncbi:lactose permease [Colletotrichum spaethianum]|uniref:Lactose permease n=1 Tax=Colletotrichum spaethianum TaxID=700344 RepID=A0AA37L1S3_9PEZI|nr:lactose permease [Colletotrichum spaethianum]GKT40262.1 lactose permease [Colletotrichum spaethianum]